MPSKGAPRLPADFWLQPFHTRDGWLIIAVNVLPLLGVVLVGWDASTLVLLYWLETAIIGFWMVVQIFVAGPEQLGGIKFGQGPGQATPSGAGLAIFLLVHAGFFMGIHLFILSGVLPGDWRRHLGSVEQFITGFVVPSALWIPLLGLFVVRGVIAVSEMRRRAHLGHMIIGFYVRIVVMQLTILLGAMATLLFNQAAVALAGLILLKTGIDLYMPHIVRYATNAIDDANKKAQSGG